MSFSINTNITSLQAQNYLRASANFQAKTINQVTSGLRIVNSGDDAAGLAIANGLRSDQATLTQGIQNANNGLSTLQTIDGGINNISTLLDRANTLATQSASGTFTGDRNVLNKEFQSVVTEIDRQAQAIGLDTGGTFAKALTVFVGGGKANSGTTAISNGSVNLDLNAATIDAKSLGLKGVQAVGVGTVDIGSGSAQTSVQAIVNDATNKSNEAAAGYTSFTFRGSGFGDANGVSVSVNLSAVNDTATLAAAINAGIQTAGNGTTQSVTAFKNAGVTASVVTDANGSHLAFSSSTAAFQVSAGDQTSNALLGNVTSASNPTGKSLVNTVTGGVATAAAATTFGASGAGTVTFRIQGSSLAAPVDLNIAVAAGETIDTALIALSTAVTANSALNTAGITLKTATAGSALVFGDNSGQKISVAASGDLNGRFGLGSFQSSTGATGNFDYSTVTGNVSGTFAASAETLEFSVGGGAKVSLAVTPGAATIAGATTSLNDAFASNSTLSKAGFVATNNGTQITITNNTGSNFQISSVGATNVFGFNNATATGLAQTANTNTAQTTSNQFETNGAFQTSTLTFTAPTLGNDRQTVTLTADDSTGTQQSLAINLQNTGSTSNAHSVDQAIDSINTAIQRSNNATLQKIVAVKDQVGGGEGIKFVSTAAFQVSPGQTGSGAGIGSQGTLVAASVTGTGSTADIGTEAGAAAAVSALADAVKSLGVAQAVVGKGENNLNYAVALAQSQVTNEAAAESRIRDADLANEAANLSKAQILVQAGTAALAQANSAPQAILSLLKG